MAAVHPTRPLGITLIAILLAINGIVAIIQAFFLISLLGAFIISLVFGVALLYLAFSMWTLQPWAWVATLILEGLNALFALVGVIFIGTLGIWVSLIVSVVIIYYLLRPEVRADFHQGAAR